jgi:hypothetical protein
VWAKVLARIFHIHNKSAQGDLLRRQVAVHEHRERGMRHFDGFKAGIVLNESDGRKPSGVGDLPDGVFRERRYRDSTI